MSLQNHPNFHAVQFTTAIVESYFNSLRGGVSKEMAPPITEEVVDFVARIEEKVDRAVAAGTKK